jgi:hypothetical protein
MYKGRIKSMKTRVTGIYAVVGCVIGILLYVFIFWPKEAVMTKSEMMAYFNCHPPRCLNELGAVPVDLIGAVFDGHGEDLNPVFHISCKCGNETGKVRGYFWTNPDFNNTTVFISPFEFICTECGAESVFFDSAEHGSDAEFADFCSTARALGNPGVFACPECKNEIFKLFVRFEYSEDLFDDNFPEFKNRQQDAFSWFTLLGQCSECSCQLTITELECA